MLADEVVPQVPGYRLTTVLGRGAGGAVWAGEPCGGGAEVAVKVVAAGPRAERELAVLSAIRHPHVVALREVLVLDDGRLALVVAKLDGGTLAQVVAARGRLRAGEVVTCLAPLAQTIADLHAQGVQHGDLAPGNVLFDRTGRPLLADLGTVRVTGEPRHEVYGTPGFVDPVILTGGLPGPASDVYGLGALAWFALAGAPPPAVPLRTTLTDVVPSAPPDIVAAIEAAVDPDPAQRPHPAELASRLRAAAVAEPVWRTGLAPADGGLTRRLRSAAEDLADDPAGAADPRGRSARHRRDRRTSLAVGAPVALGRRTGGRRGPRPLDLARRGAGQRGSPRRGGQRGRVGPARRPDVGLGEAGSSPTSARRARRRWSARRPRRVSRAGQ